MRSPPPREERLPREERVHEPMSGDERPARACRESVSRVLWPAGERAAARGVSFLDEYCILNIVHLGRDMILVVADGGSPPPAAAQRTRHDGERRQAERATRERPQPARHKRRATYSVMQLAGVPLDT